MGAGEHVRVQPLLDWTELDIWRYLEKERVPLPGMYFSRKGQRFRSLGCWPISKPVQSDAATIADIIEELKVTRTSERAGRAQDHHERKCDAKLPLPRVSCEPAPLLVPSSPFVPSMSSTLPPRRRARPCRPNRPARSSLRRNSGQGGEAVRPPRDRLPSVLRRARDHLYLVVVGARGPRQIDAHRTASWVRHPFRP